MQEQLDSDKKPQNHKLVVYTNKENMEAFNYVNSLTPEEQIIQDELQKGVVLTTNNIPYGSQIFVENGQKIAKGTKICEWDPYNAVILTEVDGIVAFENFELGVTYKEESDEQTGFTEKVISEIKDKKKINSF